MRISNDGGWQLDITNGNDIDNLFGYRPSSNVTVSSLLEQVSGLLEEEALLEGHRLTTKAGCLGVGRVAVSLPSMKTT